MYEFDLARPTSLDEALRLLGDEDAQPLAGGQTLIPTLKQRLASPSVLVSLTGIDQLRGICTGGDGRLCIGACTTHARIAAQQEFPALAELAGEVGDPAVRNRGTIGGSLANNDPSACYPAAALATGAEIVTDRRTIAADDFFVRLFETALDEGEIITEVRFPLPDAAKYIKFEQPASRFALVGVFVARFNAKVRVAITGASQEGVFRWSEAESALSDSFSAAALDRLTMSEDAMISDLHGSAAYRAHLCKVMTKRAVNAAV